jgi:hypothetical protein
MHYTARPRASVWRRSAVTEEPGSKLDDVNRRVLKDDEFRESLLSDPVATLRREFGIEVPEGVRIEVHEETEEVIHLVIPGRLPLSLIPESVLDDAVTSMLRPVQRPTACCTCGATTAQTAATIQHQCCR